MAILLDLLRPVTDEELRLLSERNPGYQFERTADGRVVVSPTGMEGGRCSAEVLRQLGEWNRRTRAGVVFDSSTGFHLPDGSLLSPDASWIRRERWERLGREEREGFGSFCPDAVFEVRSSSQTLQELRQKMQWTYPALVDRVTLTDSGFADHLLSNSSGDRYPRAECRRLRL
jgi:Uma2 family endonuclease